MKRSSKSVWSRFVMTFAAAFLLMLVTTVPVKADSSVPLVADMKQTDASTTSAGISWSCPGSEVRFKVEMSEQMSSGYWTYKESQSSASITLTKLGAGKVYYVRITPFKYNIAMSKTPHIQYLCGFARHGNLINHFKFIVTISSKWYN